MRFGLGHAFLENFQPVNVETFRLNVEVCPSPPLRAKPRAKVAMYRRRMYSPYPNPSLNPVRDSNKRHIYHERRIFSRKHGRIMGSTLTAND